MPSPSEIGYVLDTSRERLDLDAIERWLAAESYWAAGRSRADIVKSIKHSTVYGVYGPEGQQVGFARVVSDRTTFAWISDVFIDQEHRGKGLGNWAMAQIRDEILATGVYRIMLATHDAHAVYGRLGFTALPQPEQYMVLQARKTVGDD